MKGRDVVLRCAIVYIAVFGLALLCVPATAWACTTNPPTCPQCQRAVCVTGDNVWECQPKVSGTTCDDGNACTSGDHCDGAGNCVGTLTCVPGVPGAITGPSNSTTGSYTLSWGAASGVVSNYQLYENNVGIYTTTGLNASIGGRLSGSYSYKVQACNSAGCGAFTAGFTVTVLLPPGTPGAMSVPSETGPSYTVSWGAATGTVDHYDLGEQYNQSTWTTTQVTATSQAFTNKAYGSYSYQVRACNATGCSAYVTASLSVVVITGLSALADSPVVPPSVPIPLQGWVGTAPGTAGAEGGAATYRIPIEVPPGRSGMQPEISLAYRSANGNGVAGVGWSLSGSPSTIYRCPRTLAQDGGNRPVQHDASDRLCWDGQRLVGPAGSAYGSAGSIYRTEVDQFARVTLYAGMSSWSSYFQVEHKSGRISKYVPLSPGTPYYAPDVWYLDSEWDRQNNCIKYNYSPFASRGNDREQALTSIAYTGIMSPSCTTDSSARTIEFAYTSDREDKRTTYSYGVASITTVRLAAISTKVGSQYVRRYQLSYHLSAATRRSLLDSVTLCAQPGGVGAPCGGEQFPPTTFQYQEDAPNFDMWHATCQSPSGCGSYAYGQPLGPEWRMPIVGDLDGDGTRDAVYVSNSGERDLLLTSCPTPQRVDGTPYGSSFFVGFDQPWDATPLRGAADVNNDARVDIFGTSSGYLAFATAVCNGTPNWMLKTTNLQIPSSSGAVTAAWGIDYDGDGLLDAMYGTSTSALDTIALHRTTSPLDWGASAVLYSPSTPPNTSTAMATLLTRDINGDGLVDTVFDDVPPTTSPDTTTIGFLMRLSATPPYTFASSQPYTYQSLPDLGGPSGWSFGPGSGRRWIDVNGDGLPDIYDPAGYIWINMGGLIGAGFPKIFQARPLTIPTLDPHRTYYQFVMDIDSDGREELLVPNSRVYNFCYSDSTKVEPVLLCGADFDTPSSYSYGYDQSVFSWDAYKFIEAADGSYSMVKVSTNLLAPTNVQLTQNDSNGDGSTDLYYRLKNTTLGTYPAVVHNYYDPNSLPASALGPYIARNLAHAPDLLTSVRNGLGATASWKHRPLSSTASAIDPVRDYDGEVGCDMPDPAHPDLAGAKSFYVAHLPTPDLTSYSDHAFFASSMWAVARLDVSNGVGAGTNKTCYRYQDAMLNTQGRGFQGFKTMVSEEQVPPAAGEPGSAPQGCGGLCSVNNLKTTTQFHQAPPLTGKPMTVTVANRATGAILHQTSYWWHIDGGSLGQKIVFSSGTLEQKYETNGTLAVQTTTVSQVQPSLGVPTLSGEPVKTCVIVNGETPTSPPNAGTASDVIRLETRALHDDTSTGVWWLGRLDSRVLLSDFFGSSYSLPACNVSDSTNSFAGACASSPPTCPIITASNNAKTQTANYQWWQDSDPQGSRRKLKSEAITIPSDPLGTSEVSTSYSYDSNYGNLLNKTATARDVGTDATWPPQTRGASTMPSTTYGYSSDNYFRTSETDPASHTSTRTVDPATGLVLTSQAIQGGPVTTNSYDDIGRLFSSVTTGSQPAQVRITGCTAGNNCAWKEQSLQSGAPVKTTYRDLLGRAIASGTEGFDGKEIITKVTFNERGIKIAEYPPYHLSTLPGGWDGAAASPYPTSYSGIDALGRSTAKTVQRDPVVCQAGTCDAALNTTYAYAVVPTGVQTLITVSKAAAVGGVLTMWRTYDRRGKLVQTIQHVSAPTAHNITTSYYYDPAGNLTNISDTVGNQIKAAYDDLGRKLTVNDPDRGNWTYTWDGLGRLRTQMDARGVMLAYEYDVDGRLERRFTQGPSDAQASLEANWQYDLNGKAGTLGSLIGVADGFRRDYSYDSLLRPWRVSTYVPGSSGYWSARQFNIEYGYDHNYGRSKAMAYPGQGDTATGPASGEIIGFNYSAPQGYPIGESANAPAGSPVYRTVTAMSERGQIIAQNFANGVLESATYDDSTGLPLELLTYNLNEFQPSGCSAQLVARQVDYKFDQFLNLASQSKQFLQRNTSGQLIWQGCNPAGATATETYQYDELQRLVATTRSWVGMTPAPYPTINGASHTYGDSYTYDDLGNILSKPDYAMNYTYGSSARAVGNAGPHAVSTVTESGVTTAPFSYDLNGNMLSGDGRTATFDYLDRPVVIAKGSVTTQFKYAPDGARYLQYTSGIGASPYPKAVYYVDKSYERIDWSSAVTEEKTYVGPSVMVYKQGTSRDVRYLHMDRLGSLDAVTSSAGAELPGDSHGFDAFGMPRARDWQWSGAKMHPDTDYQKTTERGFTGHEHLDETYLIHMNGRIYDYRLGRFLSVDPIISNPTDSQSINPYSYIGNNPLSGVDPTGYCDAKFCPHDGTLFNDSQFSNVLNSSEHDSVVTGGSNRSQNNASSGAQGQRNVINSGPADQTGNTKDPSFNQIANGISALKDIITTAAGAVYGGVQGITPGGFLLPSPAPDNPYFEGGRSFGLGTASFIDGAKSLIEGASAIAMLSTGVGSPLGVVVSGAAVVDGVNAVGAAGAAKQAWSNAMQMRGDGRGAEGASKTGESPVTTSTGRTQPLTNAEARTLAKDLGFTPVKDPPFNSRGELVFRSGNKFITPDNTVHQGGTWKMFDRSGNRLGTFNETLTIRIGD
jgi:RHS repeat-associated protein